MFLFCLDNLRSHSQIKLPLLIFQYHINTLSKYYFQKAINFRQGYGLTETNGGISVGRNDDNNHASVGHVFPSSEVKIADLQTQEALGPGQVREAIIECSDIFLKIRRSGGGVGHNKAPHFFITKNTLSQ